MVVFVCLCSLEARGFTCNRSTSSGMHKTRRVDSRSRVDNRYLTSLRKYMREFAPVKSIGRRLKDFDSNQLKQAPPRFKSQSMSLCTANAGSSGG